jgi:hypothetical protein
MYAEYLPTLGGCQFDGATIDAEILSGGLGEDLI